MNEKGGGWNKLPSWSGKCPGRGLPAPPPASISSSPHFFLFCTLFVFRGSHFNSSPLPGLEVREETTQGVPGEADFLADAGDGVSPPGFPGRAAGDVGQAASQQRRGPPGSDLAPNRHL